MSMACGGLRHLCKHWSWWVQKHFALLAYQWQGSVLQSDKSANLINISTWSWIFVNRMHPKYAHTVFMFIVNEYWVLFHQGRNSQGMKMTPYIHLVQRLRIGRAVSPCAHTPSWHTCIFTLWYMTICDSRFILD